MDPLSSCSSSLLNCHMSKRVVLLCAVIQYFSLMKSTYSYLEQGTPSLSLFCWSDFIFSAPFSFSDERKTQTHNERKWGTARIWESFREHLHTDRVCDWLITMADQKSSSFLCTSHLTHKFIFLKIFCMFFWCITDLLNKWTQTQCDHNRHTTTWPLISFLFPCPFCRKNRKK